MNAILLAAGRGQRLQPITDYVPKPLLPIVNRPIIDIAIARLRDAGIRDLGINLWYKADEIAMFLKKYTNITLTIEDELLGTGGALRNFKNFVTDDFVMHNTDIVTAIDIQGAVGMHRLSNAVATLVLTQNTGTNVVKVNSEQRVTEFCDRPRDECFTFTGIAVLSPVIFSYFPEEKVFSMIDVYKKVLSDRQSIFAVVSDAAWYDIGSFRQYWQVHHDLQTKAVNLPQFSDAPQHCIDRTSTVRSKRLTGFVTVGSRCHIGEHVRLQDTVVFSGTRVETGDYTRALLSNHFCISV